jgi:2-succinyl-6-hydroxy-2,4-cyclohexadiene-1-carboxylate synthase
MLLLHGFTGSGQDFESLAAHLPVGRQLAPDLAGPGPPPGPDELSCYTMAACVAQVIAGLDVAGWARGPVLGYSMGARCALALALAHPERVSALVLVGGTPGLADAGEAAARRAADEALADHIEQVGTARFLEEWARVPIIASQANIAPDALARMRARRAGLSPRGLAQSLRGMGTGAMPSMWGRLDQVRCPALLVTGALDAKFCDIARQMAAGMADARHVIIAGVGHTAHLEAPEAVGRAVRAFLDQADRN